jgi:PAS domain S-box-containing protein
MPLIPEEDQAVVTAHVTQLSPQQPVATYSHRVVLPDGGLRWQQWTDRAIFNSQGEIVEFQSVGRDITDQKQAEAELQAAYHKLERRNQQLAHILETGNHLRLGLNLDAVLQQIADGIHQALGFEAVAVSLVEPASQRVRLAAHTGRQRVAQPAFSGGVVHMSWEQSGQHLLQEQFRTGGCYFIASGALDWSRQFARYEPGEADRRSEWQPDDALVVPLQLRSGRLAGLISVDRPADGRRPDAAILQGLEIFANQAVAAIENAWTYEQLQQELTESHQMETALRESEHRLQLALEAANAGVWSWDMASGRAYWSEENYRVMGLEPGSCESTFANWLQRVDPADQERVQVEISRAVEQRESLDLVYRCVWPSGETRWIRDIGKLEFDAAGRPARMTGVQVDITNLKRTEDALRDSERRYRLLAENVTDVIWVRDLNLRPTYISPSVQRLRGFSAEEALAQPLTETLTPQSAALAGQFFAEMLHSAQQWRSEALPFQSRRLTLEVRRRDGSTVWTESRVSFLVDEHGQPTAILGVTRDIKDRD